MRIPLPKLTEPVSVSKGAPQSVGRIFAILENLAGAGRGITLSELAVKTSAPKTSLVGLLTGLVAEGYLLRDDAGRYSLGPAFLSLALRSIAGRELVKLAKPIMTELMQTSGETVIYGTLSPEGDLVQYLDKVESLNSIRYAVEIGERRELYCISLGKVILAYLEPARLKAYLKSVSLVEFTPNTLTSVEDLRKQLVKIREEGIARAREERIIGAYGISVPIFSADGKTVAALAIAGPSDRMQDNADLNERLLKRAGADITRLAGGKRA